MKKLKFLVSLHTKDNDFQIAQAAAAKEAAHKCGVDAEITFADNNAVNQSTEILTRDRPNLGTPRIACRNDLLATARGHGGRDSRKSQAAGNTPPERTRTISFSIPPLDALTPRKFTPSKPR